MIQALWLFTGDRWAYGGLNSSIEENCTGGVGPLRTRQRNKAAVDRLERFLLTRRAETTLGRHADHHLQ